MTRRVLKWLGLGLLCLLALVGLSLYWLAATESGTRWIAARIEPLFPEALDIGSVDGTLLRGLGLNAIRWHDESVDASVARLSVRAEILPLFDREIRIVELAVRDANVEILDRTTSSTDDRPFSLEFPMALDVQEAAVDGLRIAYGDSELLIDRIGLAGRLSKSTLEVRQLIVRSELADIDLHAETRLGDDFPTRLTGSWQLRLSGQPPLSGRLSVRGNMNGYELTHDVTAPYAVATTGTLRVVDGQPAGEFDNTWQQLRVPLADGRTVNIEDGRLSVSGTIEDFSFDAAARVAVGDIAPVSVSARGRRALDIVALESLLLTGDVGQLQATGSVTIAPEISWMLDFTAMRLDPSFADPRLSGSLNVDGKSTGSLKTTGPEMQITIERLAGLLNGHPVSGGALVGYRQEQLTLRDAAVSVGDNRVDGSATIGREVRAKATIRLSDLAQLGIGAGGALEGDLALHSNPDSFQLSGKLSGKSLSWQTYGAASMSARFDARGSGSGSADIQAADVRLGELQVASGALTIDGDLRSHDVQLDLSIEEVRTQLRLAGGLLDQAWSGTVESLVITGERPGEWRLQERAPLVVSRDAARLGNACLVRASASGRACFEIDYETSGPVQFDVKIDDYPVAALPLYLPEGASIQGTLHASAIGRIVDRSVSADATVAAEGLRLNALFEGDEISAAFDLAEATAAIVDNRLVADLRIKLEDSEDHLRSRIEIADVFDTGSSLRGNGDLEMTDLELLGFFYPDITNPAGRIAGNVGISGSMQAPEIIGEVGLENGSFGIRRAGISIKEMAVSLRQDSPGLLLLEGHAESGDGSIDIRGMTSVSSDSGIRTELSLKGDAFTLLRLPDWYVTASPDISVVFDDRELRVNGDLRIPAATINIRGVPESADRPSADVIVHRDAEPLPAPRRQFFVDVRTVLGDEVSFSGFGLTTELEGGVRITASSVVPVSGAGRVVLREGRYKAYGQTLDIESGELVFNGPLDNPALSVRANRKASDGTVAGIHLTGTARQLTSRVYSEPPLDDAEALSYLLTGRPLASADSADGAMLNQAAFALGLTTAGSIASRVRDQLGLDTLGIQGGAENRQFVAGKRFGERLFVEYAYGIIDNLGTLLLRYQLTSRLVVESRSGSVRNVDLVYSVRKP